MGDLRAGEQALLEKITQLHAVGLTEGGAVRAGDLVSIRPVQIRGSILFCDKDNLNTDGICGKEFTYRDDLTPAEMGRKAMLDFDPAFQEIAREGDILVGGGGTSDPAPPASRPPRR